MIRMINTRQQAQIPTSEVLHPMKLVTQFMTLIKTTLTSRPRAFQQKQQLSFALRKPLRLQVLLLIIY